MSAYYSQNKTLINEKMALKHILIHINLKSMFCSKKIQGYTIDT